jgi:hypothetical protein
MAEEQKQEKEKEQEQEDGEERTGEGKFTWEEGDIEFIEDEEKKDK